MSVIGLPNGRAQHVVDLLLRLYCASCDVTRGIGLGGQVAPGDFTLARLTELARDREAQVDLSCEGCGRPLEVQDTVVVYHPSESDLPALVIIGRDGETTLWLTSSPERVITTPAAEWGTPLARDSSEDDLRAVWGRYLSTRAGWWSLFQAADAAPGTPVVRDLAPSLTALAMRVGTGEEDRRRAMAVAAEALAGEVLVVGLPAVAFNDEDHRGWTGPWSDRISDASLLAAFRISGTEVEALVDAAARAAGLTAVDDPRIGADLPAHIASFTSDDTPGWWLTDEAEAEGAALVPFVEVPQRVASQGLSFAEAATAAVTAARARREGARALAERVRTEMDDTEVTLVREDLMVLARGDLQSACNPISILAKHQWDPARVRLESLFPTLDPGGAPIATCCAEEHVSCRLRPAGFAAERLAGRPSLAWEVHDDLGAAAEMVAVMDCPHRVSYPGEDALTGLTGSDDVRGACEEGLYRSPFVADVQLVTGADGSASGAILSGVGIATLLADDRLLALLSREVRRLTPLRGALRAEAITTDVIGIYGSPDGGTLVGEAMRARAARSGPPPGHLLRFLRNLPGAQGAYGDLTLRT